MKIAWFTPFVVKSAIGNYSKNAVEALERYTDAKVDVFALRDTDSQLRQTSVNVVEYRKGHPPIHLLSQYDAVVYNMGDNLEFHADIYEIAQQWPGVVIDHDACMLNFIKGYCIATGGAEKFRTLVDVLFGEGTGRTLEEDLNNPITYTRVNFLKYNMQKPIVQNAAGVVVHSEYHKKILEEQYDGPITVIPHIATTEYREPHKDAGFAGYAPGKLNILSVGLVNWNKQADKVMDAIAGSPYLRENVRYTLVGATDNQAYLSRLLQKLREDNLDDCVKIMGRVDYETLDRYYDHADVICNLRYPALEGGSGSLEEQLVQGKPVIVMDTGVYSEMPDDCVVKIDVRNLKQELPQKLERLARDNAYREQIGRNAAAFAKEEFSREKYANLLHEFLEQPFNKKNRFLMPLYQVTKKIERELAYLGLDTAVGDPALKMVGHVAEEVKAMFDIPGDMNT
ncbi:MAG: glycosyltransferase family 4 protein [Christensenellaceae bacterium]|jgi:glycosyltransferase involved in cell wall biosynthesis